ncbi:MAG: hypothetical protein ABI947_27825 [Chloroflexota bacterium]
MPGSIRLFQHLSIRSTVAALVFLLVISACGQNVTKEGSAAALLPSLAGYQTAEVMDIKDALAKIGAAASLGSGQPEITAAIAGVSSLISCYQKAGAVEGRTYVKTTDLTKAGVVIVINKNAVTNPALFANCVSPFQGDAPPTGPHPCGKFYTLDKDNNQFYIAYAATYPEVCTAICSATQGCTTN